MHQVKNFLIVLLFFGLMSAYGQSQSGKASYYAGKFHGRITASGETYDSMKMTAAHRTLPFGTTVKVSNLRNNKTTTVVINDRGPFVSDRIIDLSYAAGASLSMIDAGVTEVRIEVVTGGITMIEELKPPTFFHVKVTEMSPSGYGVQIMSFAETDNYVNFVKELQKKYKSEDIVLQSKSVNGRKVIGVVLHQFNTRMQAERLQVALEPNYPDCYIVDFSKFN
ncbi:MAG: septal ring lytic transglycosylase RlpA family protein [Bacteroidota bacterium]